MPDDKTLVRIRLIDEWRAVLKKAWSIWLMAGCVIVIVLEPVINTVVALITGNAPWWVSLSVSLLAGLLGLAAIWARITVQKDITK